MKNELETFGHWEILCNGSIFIYTRMDQDGDGLTE